MKNLDDLKKDSYDMAVLHDTSSIKFDEIEKRCKELKLTVPMVREVVVSSKSPEGLIGIQTLKRFEFEPEGFDTSETLWVRLWIHPNDYAKQQGRFSVIPMHYPVPVVLAPVITEDREAPTNVNYQQMQSKPNGGSEKDSGDSSAISAFA